MTKYAAFGTHLEVGTAQIETVVVVGTITGTGNATFTITHAGMTGTPLAVSVAVVDGDIPTVVATKAAATINALSDVTDHMTIKASGSNIVFELLAAAANEGAFNIAYTNGTCTGLTPNATSTDTQAGAAKVEVAAVSNIGGPPLAVDTEDVTTHDNTAFWEEVVLTILRTGEVTLDLVYDPADNTQDFTDTGGLGYRMEGKVRTYFDLMFMGGALNWTFFGYVVGFEPASPVGGALTATVKIKITGEPTLE